jgi:hypothetical protein
VETSVVDRDDEKTALLVAASLYGMRSNCVGKLA